MSMIDWFFNMTFQDSQHFDPKLKNRWLKHWPKKLAKGRAEDWPEGIQLIKEAIIEVRPLRIQGEAPSTIAHALHDKGLSWSTTDKLLYFFYPINPYPSVESPSNDSIIGPKL